MRLFVFADDSSFECALMQTELPQTDVVHLSGDPSGYADAVLAQARFMQLELTGTDGERTQLYRDRRQRQELSATYTSPEEFLRDLDLRVVIRQADEFTIPRLVQLEQRTNQFRTTARAHGEALTRRMAASVTHAVLSVEVSDRLGDEGVVGGAWLNVGPAGWTIVNLLLSCRVLSRGIELALLRYVQARAFEAGVGHLDACFEHTGRNRPAAQLYPTAGFDLVSGDDSVAVYRCVLSEPPLPAPDWLTVDSKEVPHHA